MLDDPLTAELYRREVEAWEIFKRKDKEAYARGIADDAIGCDLSGERLKDKAATVNDINAVDVWTHYEIRDFKAEALAPDVALVHYFANVSGITAGQQFTVKIFIREVFVRRDGQWLVRYYQNTAAK
jgi:uncharacterized protein (TIGR02246 family)